MTHDREPAGDDEAVPPATADAAASGTPASDAPASDAPSSDAPASDAPSSDAPSSGTPSSGTPSSGTPPVGRTRTTGDYVRAGVRGVGQTLVTLGLVVLLFVVYEVWVTNLYADTKQHKAQQALTQQWQGGKDPLKSVDRPQLPAGKQVVLPAGQGFANLYIPTLGSDYAYTIVEGTNEGDLERGPGHYTQTAIPGQIGNFAVAGHRVGKGEPFLNLDKLRPGDAVVVQTASRWYVYKVLGNTRTGDLAATDSQGTPGRQVVLPSDVDVIDPVPGKPGQTPTRALMTMTTCEPKYSADKRMIIHAALARSVARSGNSTPKELGGTL